MALRTALVIDGNSTEARRALAELDRSLDLVAQSAQQTSRDLVVQQASSVQAMQRTTAAASAQRAGMQQLSMQLNDVATMFAMGARPMQIFASQSGQVIQAVQMMTGGTSRLAAFLGGPWGMAISTATLVLSPLIAKLFDAESALDGVGDAAEEAMRKLDQSLAQVSDFQNAIDLNQTKLLTNMGNLARANREIAQATRLMNEMSRMPGGAQAVEGLAARLARAEAEKAVATKEIAEARGALAGVRARMTVQQLREENRDRLSGSPGRDSSTRERSSGPSIADIARRFDDQLIGYTQQSLSAMQQLAASAQERAELEMRSVEWTRRQTLSSIAAAEDYSAIQRAELAAAVERLTNHQRDLVEFRMHAQLEKEAQELAALRHDVALDALDAQRDLAGTEAERKSLALQIYDAETEHLRWKLEQVIHSKTAAEREKRNAQLELNSLNTLAGARREGVSRANATSVERYLRELHQTPAEIGEAIDRIKIDGLEALNNELTETIGNVLKVGGVFGDVANQIITDLVRIGVQRAIIGPLANMLFPGGPENLLPGGGGFFGNIGGLLGGLLGGLFGGGRADGGPISPGRFYAVNERSTAPGLFFPIGPGRIEPAGATQAGSAARSIVEVHVVGGELFDARVHQISGDAAVEVVRSTAPAIVDVAAAETYRRLSRPRM